jgi:hypothetical protein
MFGRLLSPILLLAIHSPAALAQAQDNASSTTTPSASASSSAPASATAPKKVWTNENIAGAKGGVSVVGNKGKQNYPMTAAPSADAATVDRIKKSLQKLQGQLADVNTKLASFKQFQDGDHVSTGERDTSKSYSRTPVDQQIVQLQAKKKDLTAQIGDLIDEARKKGIDPGQLR